MLVINCVAILGIVCMLLCYRPARGFLRDFSAGGKRRGGGIDEAQEKKIGRLVFAATLAAAFFVRLVAGVVYRGHETDMNCFTSWSDMVFNDGFANFYSSDAFTDYPPGYMYILYVVGWIRSLLHLDAGSAIGALIVKMPAILADIAAGALIYHVASKRMKETGAALVSALYLFCPAVILDSAVWGQTDAVFTFFVALMCCLVSEKKLIPAYFAFAAGILIKPQTLIFTPVLIFGIVDFVFLDGFSAKKFFKNLGFGLLAILAIALLMMPFGFGEALSQYAETLGSYGYASVNAYNIWNLVGLNWVDQNGYFLGLTYKTWGTIAIVLIVAGSAVISFRCKKSPSKYCFIGAFIVTMMFMFSVRMHERYMFPALLLLLLCYAMRPRGEIYLLYVGLCAASFYNMAHVLFFYDPNNFNRLEPAAILISLGMLVVAAYMAYVAVKVFCMDAPEKDIQKIAKGAASGREKTSKKKNENPICPSSEPVKMQKADYIAMFVIMAAYSLIAFARLGDMSAPETGMSLTDGGENTEIVLDMGEDKRISQLWDFLGYKENRLYYIQYASDGGKDWTELCGEGSEWDSGSVFAWNSKDMGIDARYIKISPAKENTEDQLLELVLLDGDGNTLLPVNYDKYLALFDEQDMFDGRKSNMNSTYFDEIYHARTAYEMIHHLYCYENTHPPLGKILIAAGILIFGMNPFGWRFMGTLFGVLMIPIIYNFSKKFFKETWISIVTTLLFTFDFMHFVQTRIATIDVFVTLFIMLAYYFMYCYTRYSFYDADLKKTFVPLGLCGISMGLSWASKWTGIYASVGLAVIFFAKMVQRFREYVYACGNINGKTGNIEHRYIVENFYNKLFKTIGFCCIFFILVPAVIYTLSYIPFNDGTDRGLVSRMITAQSTMFNYHSTLKAEHDFSSKWYQWPIMYRPIWYYSGVISDKLREGISAFGNPLVWWAGIPASLYMVYLIFKDRDKRAAFLTVGYLSQYAPWILVSRTVFIYHYFPSVPFVAAMVGYSIYKIVKRYPFLKKAAYVYAALAIGLFFLFYPVLSGKAISPEFATKWLIWFKSWVLLQTW